MTNNYLLADKLKREFSNRGVKASASSAERRETNRRSAEPVTINRRYHAPDPSRPPRSRRPSYSADANATDRSTIHTDAGTNVKTVQEVKVRKKRLSPLLPVLLLITTIMIMTAVATISEAYQKTTEVSRLENELETLVDQTEELKLKLEEKNDIRTIGTLATTKLGMTKEDSLQRRYVSLSDGERIELIETETEENPSGGVLLSAFAGYLERIADRFR